MMQGGRRWRQEYRDDTSEKLDAQTSRRMRERKRRSRPGRGGGGASGIEIKFKFRHYLMFLWVSWQRGDHF